MGAADDMTGIYGVVDPSCGEKTLLEQLGRFRKAETSAAPGEGAALASPGVVLGARGDWKRNAGTAKSSLGDAELLLAFEGTLFQGGKAGTGGAQTGSDLLALYLKEGLEFVKALDGEFSLAIWDGRTATLHLAADRFRFRPVVYACFGERFAFAPDLNALLTLFPAGPGFTVDPVSIYEYLALSIVPTPRTIYKEAFKLPAGTVLSFRSGKTELREYFDLDFSSPFDRSERELRARAKEVLKSALEKRIANLGGEGCFGSFLSGGIDSSSVVALLSLLGRAPVKTFSIGFAAEGYNELEYARIVAKEYATEHFEHFVTPQEVREAIPTLVDAFDEPYGNSSAIPTFYCALLAKEAGVRYLFAGDGGDELFAGNERYAQQRLFDYYADLPSALREYILQPAIEGLAKATRAKVFLRGKKYIRRASIPYPERLVTYGFFKTEPPEALFSDDFLAEVAGADPYRAVRDWYSRAKAHTALDRQLYVDLKVAITDNDLRKVTRMTETADTAVGYPFLDRDVVDFACKVPARLKMRGTQLRSFFKRAFRDVLPRATIRKKKHGFGLPIPVWLREDPGLKEMLHDLLLSGRAFSRGYFSRSGIEALIEKHASDRTSFYGTALWHLMALELWHRRRIDSR